MVGKSCSAWRNYKTISFLRFTTIHGETQAREVRNWEKISKELVRNWDREFGTGKHSDLDLDANRVGHWKNTVIWTPTE